VLNPSVTRYDHGARRDSGKFRPGGVAKSERMAVIHSANGWICGSRCLREFATADQCDDVPFELTANVGSRSFQI
jgi:hypothetical protein